MTDDRYSMRGLADDARTHDARAPAVARFVLRWIPAIVLAYAFLISPVLTEWGSSGTDTDINIVAARSNLFNEVFWLGVFAATVLSAWHNMRHIARLLGNPVILLMLAYLAFAGLSVLWSPVPGIAFRRLALQIIVVLALGISTALADDREALLERVLVVVVATVLLNTIVVLATPPGPIGHEGIYSQKNGLGAAMAFAVLFCIYGASTRRGWLRAFFVALTLAAFFALIMSRSKTSLGLVTVVPILVYLSVAISRTLRLNAALFMLFFAALGLAGWLYLSALMRFSFSDLSMLLFGDESFTGRTYIWRFVLDVIARHPMIGQGYSSFWGIGAGSIVEREAPGFVGGLLQAHNGYLDVLIETGFIGLTILVALILTVMAEAAHAAERRPALGWLSLTLALTVVFHNGLESSWFRGYSLIWMMFVFAALLPRASTRGAA